mmetsp:Transcript_33016/g.81239  ORF Transcript_33016/g.81239 Transcript_33016/m.81239 type:complete len:289 (+) Transcript_33016:215-1081(+)
MSASSMRWRRKFQTYVGVRISVVPPAAMANSSVVWPLWEVSSERWRSSPCPASLASAAASTSVGFAPSSSSPAPSGASSSSLAASRNSFAAPLLTARTCSMTILAAAATISAGCGGEMRMNLKPPLRSMLGTAHSERGVHSVTLMPVAPARPVRPLRWMYVSASLGGSHCTTISTPVMSRPRAATSVATSVWNLLARNPASTTSRWAWLMSPCSALAPFSSSFCSASCSSLQSRLVSQNTMTRPPPGTLQRMRSTTSSVRSVHWQCISMCVTRLFAPGFVSPTRSTVW